MALYQILNALLVEGGTSKKEQKTLCFMNVEQKYDCDIRIYSESRLMLSLVNVISRLMWSHFKVPFNTDYYVKTIGYCYHSVNVITFGVAQSDHIKRLLGTVYKKKVELWSFFR